ncbi:YgcG family protein [Accumulibacter sp.]|uniref:TPM domain-containing protein n=1 Tax=Accumulibacter sp. TaxID=2053492 RepID=UPI0028C447E0|nr:YgcG family protein [Accumulibacter sp.]
MPKFPARPVAWLFSLLLLLGGSFASGAEQQAVPPLEARVTDLTGTLSSAQKAAIEAKLAAFEREKGSQIAVLIVATVRPEAIEQYALRVVEAWKLGRQGVDDGALLLVARDDRRLRIEVGYGLEGALNDATAKRIISETITPRFKQGDFYGGIDAGVDAMTKVVADEPLPAPRSEGRQQARVGDAFDTLLFAGIFLVFVVGRVLRAVFGRLLAAGIVAVAAAVIASLLLSSLLLAAILGLVAFVVSLFAGALSAGRGTSRGGPWGGGGGRSGGFSGGGGGFGGGGASGRW